MNECQPYSFNESHRKGDESPKNSDETFRSRARSQKNYKTEEGQSQGRLREKERFAIQYAQNTIFDKQTNFGK